MIKPHLEYLYHFLYPSCDKWWSIGDWDETDTIICPYCGEKHEVIK